MHQLKPVNHKSWTWRGSPFSLPGCCVQIQKWGIAPLRRRGAECKYKCVTSTGRSESLAWQQDFFMWFDHNVRLMASHREHTTVKVSLMSVARVRIVLDRILYYLGDVAADKDGSKRCQLQFVSKRLQWLVQQRHSSKDDQDNNRPCIYYEYAPHIQSPYFQLVDALLLPARHAQARSDISLSVLQKASLWDCKPCVAYVNKHIGWGVTSGTVIPKDKLLFAYYGEFISTSETTSRHAKNDRDQVSYSFDILSSSYTTYLSPTANCLLFVYIWIQPICRLYFWTQVMNYILTIREHIPASETTCGGVLVSNIDASNFGSLAR